VKFIEDIILCVWFIVAMFILVFETLSVSFIEKFAAEPRQS
jgi:hypothetical protein